MASENPFMNSLRENNLVDDREIAFVADVVSTNGNRGRTWFFLNGSMLHLYEMTGMAAMGEHIETLDLKGAEVLKASSFVLRSSLKLNAMAKRIPLRALHRPKGLLPALQKAVPFEL